MRYATSDGDMDEGDKYFSRNNIKFRLERVEVMSQIPKDVEKLLQKRKNLAEQLMCVGAELDEYCETIGIAPGYEDACLGSHFMIYTEPASAYLLTRTAIEEKLGIRQTDETPKTVLSAERY